ncbi:stage II sporulation protein M [Archaeoglobus neptunius]|uniref:stage II sporulation protein M n=1 Tax=Archaeoglobus neptunius TaxID=2798580 RepID=UPI001927CC15|nr:stage II sporulation protein M [Archaeoglobus neptunius]
MYRKLILFTTFVFSVGFIFGLYSNWVQSSYYICAQKYDYANLSIYSILRNNIKVIIFIVGGCATFGTTTTINLLLNGHALGTVVSTFYSCLGAGRLSALILPHGIFEIPAIIIAGAAGFKIPYEIIRYLLGKKERILTKEDIKECLTLALISIILIVIAAWVEANVTLRIAKTLTKGI